MTIKMSRIKKTALLSVALPLMIGLSGAYAQVEHQAPVESMTNEVSCKNAGGFWIAGAAIAAESTETKGIEAVAHCSKSPN